VEIETRKAGAEVLALVEDGQPAQAGLKAFQAELFEQAAVLRDRKTPFVVVVVHIQRRGQAPAAAFLPIGRRRV
jgi:hypothetical protein